MRVQEDNVLRGQILEAIAQGMEDDGPPRPEGIHVSDLLFCLRKAVVRRFQPDPISPQRTLLFAMGRGMQAYLSRASQDEPPMVLDGIWGTVDQLQTGVPALPLEYKATFSHPGWGPSAHYFQQLASYCKMQGVLEGALVLFYVDGYRAFPKPKGFTPPEGPKGTDRPVLLVYRVAFSQDDLDNWWWEMLQRKNVLENALEEAAPLTLQQRVELVPLTEHWTWECGACPLGGLCLGGLGTYEQRRFGYDRDAG